MRLRTLVASIASVGIAASLLGGCAGETTGYSRVEGQSGFINGQRVSTWADVDSMNRVQAVGVTLPASLIQNPPHTQGTGPAGAQVSLLFPEVVRNTTFFNHFQAHHEHEGHPPPMYSKAHWDFHFYGIPEDQVLAIAPPDSVAPAANRVPPGYIYPGVEQAVPEMGVHAIPESDLDPEFNFQHTMIFGYWGGNMIFVEPMITDAFLQGRQTWSTPLAQPQVLGRSALFPRRFESRYNAATNTYTLIYSDFHPMN
jgi:hypothetical protein